MLLKTSGGGHPETDHNPLSRSITPNPWNLDSYGCPFEFQNAKIVGIEYDRKYSAKNSRISPARVEVWMLDKDCHPIHSRFRHEVGSIYESIFMWKPTVWFGDLETDAKSRLSVLRMKSDFFWESLAQHFAERVFDEHLTESIFLFGPKKQPDVSSLEDAHITFVRITIEQGTDPLNPPKRRIIYRAERGQVTNPDVWIEVGVPYALKGGRDVFDMRPVIDGQRDFFLQYSVRAHIPRGRRQKSKNTDFPDFNLIFIPLRHLVLQGDVDDPNSHTVKEYPSLECMGDAFEQVVNAMRSPEGSEAVVNDIERFITEKYYSVYIEGDESEGPTDDELPHFSVDKFGFKEFRSYILGKVAGLGRGLSPDFGDIELIVDGHVVRTAIDPCLNVPGLDT